VVDIDTPLGQQLLHIPVGQAKRRYQRTATAITSAGNRNRPVVPEHDQLATGESQLETVAVRFALSVRRTVPRSANSGASRCTQRCTVRW
jgi:hypothetical protein